MLMKTVTLKSNCIVEQDTHRLWG